MAVNKKRGLGRGMEALFGQDTIGEESDIVSSDNTEPAADNTEAAAAHTVKTSLIVPNPDQPRKNFDKEALDELTESVKVYGIVDPILVRKKGDLYEIVAGERRWRAAQAAGLKEVPVLVRDYDDRLAAEIAIIENLQREDLNPVEEARAYEKLMLDYELSQEEVAERVSKSRSAVTNTLRLLKLDPRVISMLTEGSISAGHARALLALTDGSEQKALADLIVSGRLSVRETEKHVRTILKNKDKPVPVKKEPDNPNDDIFYREFEDRMKSVLGTKVLINRKDREKGRIEIEYYSQDELERLLSLLGSVKQ